MFNQNNYEKDIRSNEKKIQELSIRMEVLEKEVRDLFDELQVKPEQISRYLACRDNFTRKNWEELESQKRILQEALQQKLENIRNPKKNEEAWKNLSVNRNWLFVR